MKYAELSDEAKAKAREWWLDLERETWGTDHAPDYYEDMATCLSFLGIEVDKRRYKISHVKDGSVTEHEEWDFEWSGFWSQGDGLVFQGKWAAERVDLDKLLDYAPQDEVLRGICTEMTALMLRHPQAIAKVTTVSRGLGLPGMQLMDAQTEPWDDPTTDIPVLPDEDETALLALCHCAAYWCYHQLESNYESDTSDEAAEEAIEANEYEFDEDGQFEVAYA